MTIVIFAASSFRRNKLNSRDEKSTHETGFELFMMILVHFFMPVLSIYPSVYVWYDYMTNEQLAYSPQGKSYFIEKDNKMFIIGEILGCLGTL